MSRFPAQWERCERHLAKDGAQSARHYHINIKEVPKKWHRK